MDRRKAAKRQSGSASSGNPTGRAAPKRGSSNGATTLFFIMGGVVLAAVAGALVIGGGEDKPKPQAKAGNSGYVSVKPKRNFKPQEPWTGEINGRHGTVRQGMSESQVIAQFKPPEVAQVTHDEYDGIRTLEFADDVGQGGIMRMGGGVKLIVKIDMKTNKVVWFRPPQRHDPNQ